jgi:hypothetical protein
VTAYYHDLVKITGLTRDDRGHRVYKAVHMVYTDSQFEGAYDILNFCVANPQGANLPLIGDHWKAGGDEDIWAFCLPDAEVTPVLQPEEDANFWWHVTLTFSTKGMPRRQAGAADGSDPVGPGLPFAVGNPLLEPADIQLEFAKYTEEATFDRFGNPTSNSSFETFRGPQNEWDMNRPSVKVIMNVPNAPVGGASDPTGLGNYIDKVNDAVLWGIPARCVKLSHLSSEKHYYMRNSVYYRVTMTFDVRYPKGASIGGGFDRDLIDKGNMVLNGEWGKMTGSGTTISTGAVDAGGGLIHGTEITVMSGTGYPPNSNVNLLLKPGGNEKACVTVTTDGAGDVNSNPIAVVTPGAGYTASTTYPTDTPIKGTWNLKDIDGGPPDPSNPSHYCQYKDQGGENVVVTLDGAGKPANAQLSIGTPAGSGCQLTVTTSGGRVMTAVVAAPGAGYPSDTVITLKVVNGDNQAAVLVQTAVNGTVESVDTGFYYPGVGPGITWPGSSYANGTWNTAQGGLPGQIHIEKYDEVNFLTISSNFPSTLNN